MSTFMVFPMAFVVLMALILMGLPIGYALGLGGIFGLYYLQGSNALNLVPLSSFQGLDSLLLVAIPLYVLAGELMNKAGAGEKIFNSIEAFVGRLPNALAVSTVIACAFFAAITGSSVAAIATIGVGTIHQMIARGYKPGLATGVVASAGTLGILIPPSTMFLIYASITQVSAGTLFMAGFLPGIMVAASFIAYLVISGLRSPNKGYYGEAGVKIVSKSEAVKGVLPMIPIPILVLGGIYSGLFTPTEAGAVALVYILIVAFTVYRLPWRDFASVVSKAGGTVGMIGLLLVGGTILSRLAAISGFAQWISSLAAGSSVHPIVIVLVINFILFFLGMIMEVTSMMILTIPIFFPIIQAIGFDPIQFGIVLTVNAELAQMTPPVGIGLYLVSGISNVELIKVIRGIIPFILILIIDLIILIIIPQISTFLPSLMR
ncbi:MAG: TRAP transporter large permease [Bacillota bacterium]